MSDFNNDRQRQPKGVPTGGQFAPGQRDEVELDLAATGLSDIEIDHLEMVRSLPPDKLERALSDHRPVVRCEAVHNPNLTPEQIMQLASPDQDVDVRRTVAEKGFGLPGLADQLASDPDSIVRFTAASLADLSEESRERLDADPQIQSIRRALAGHPPS